MAPINRIDVVIVTGNRPDADGIPGATTLGVCGREFSLSTGDLPVSAGSQRLYTLGQNANIDDPEFNDPRSPLPLDTSDLTTFPIYLKYGGSEIATDDRAHNWNLESVTITINPGNLREVVLPNPLDGDKHLWLGDSAGRVLLVEPPTGQDFVRRTFDSLREQVQSRLPWRRS